MGAEKDKRNLIKTLVAQAGDDEVGEERRRAVGAGQAKVITSGSSMSCG